MSEEDLRIQQIKMKIKGLTFEQARDISNLCSEYYIEGLEQSRFDKRMLEVELSGYRQAILQDKELMGLKEAKDKLQQENQQLKENKESWQRLANKYFNALEDIKEIFDKHTSTNELGTKYLITSTKEDKELLDIVNKVLKDSDSNE